jgi:hypothetical protein
MTARVKLYAVIDVLTPDTSSMYADVIVTLSGTPEHWRTWCVTYQRDRVDRPSRWEVGPRAPHVVRQADRILADPAMAANGAPAGLDAVPGYGSAYAGRVAANLDACHGPAWAAWAGAVGRGADDLGTMLAQLRASRRIDLALSWRYPVDGDATTHERAWCEVPAEARGWARRWALNAPEVLRARAHCLMDEASTAEALAERRAREEAGA